MPQRARSAAAAPAAALAAATPAWWRRSRIQRQRSAPGCALWPASINRGSAPPSAGLPDDDWCSGRPSRVQSRCWDAEGMPRPQVRLRQCLSHHGERALPDLLWVMLHPARAREELPMPGSGGDQAPRRRGQSACCSWSTAPITASIVVFPRIPRAARLGDDARPRYQGTSAPRGALLARYATLQLMSQNAAPRPAMIGAVASRQRRAGRKGEGDVGAGDQSGDAGE